MLLVLLLLGGLFTVLTLREEPAEGAGAVDSVLRQVGPRAAEAKGAGIVVVAGEGAEDEAFVQALTRRLPDETGLSPSAVARQPAEAREKLAAQPKSVVIASARAAGWTVLDARRGDTVVPQSGKRSIFLTSRNLLNITNQIAVIAILALGMTMVIIVRGIDLSVGSLIALSAVVTTWLIARHLGGSSASLGGMVLAGAAGIGVGALAGACSGALVAWWRVPAFIATLAMMLVAGGAAFKISGGESINQVPASFNWLGLQATAGIPHTVWLLALVAIVAHIFMTRTVLGRHIYASGGNPEAARFSGISLGRVRLIVFTLCGGFAGLGGVVVASQFNSGTPTYGQLAELDAIAAAVVGGTSLEGGRGTILGTLIGALIIAVIRNGMNLTGVDPYAQKIWLGLVILGAVLLDRRTGPGGRKTA